MASPPEKINEQLALSIQYYASKISDINTRIRILEEKIGSLSEKSKITENTLLSNFKEVNEKISENDEKTNELQKEILSMKDTIEVMLKQMKLFANKNDYKTLERYVNLFKPLQFLTKEEITQLIRREMGR
ncbi:MAG: hypothetical protein GOU97_00955 [Nanoarchaeota archaeon]|nr:hypothetical protein [Nanoarchaeota archaeon]